MMDYRAGYYKLFGEITRALCALKRGCPEAAEKLLEQAQSSAGAVGLMQLMPQTAKWLARREGIEYSEEMLLQGDYSIRLGCAYAAFLFERYDNYDCVIAAYNAGHGAVDKWLKDPEFSRDGKTLYRVPYAETEKHIVRVNRARSIYFALYPPAG